MYKVLSIVSALITGTLYVLNACQDIIIKVIGG
jgi:hypothetical protein